LREVLKKGDPAMTAETNSKILVASEISKLPPGDAFFELAKEFNEMISRRAYQLFESRGSLHGHDREDWLEAASEILLNIPVDVTETETELTIVADVPRGSEKGLEVRVAPRSVCITGERDEVSEQEEGKTVYSERRSNRIFRVLELSSEVDPNRVNATISEGILKIRLSKVGLGEIVPVLAKAASA
jgi:HSP20 family molecular chaperone IbpA